MAIQIGPTLKTLLKTRRITLKEVSSNTGVPSSTLSEWLNNRSPKNPEQIRKVAEYLEVSLHYLLFGIEDKQEPISKILKEDFFSGTFEINIKRIHNSSKAK